MSGQLIAYNSKLWSVCTSAYVRLYQIALNGTMEHTWTLYHEQDDTALVQAGGVAACREGLFMVDGLQKSLQVFAWPKVNDDVVSVLRTIDLGRYKVNPTAIGMGPREQCAVACERELLCLTNLSTGSIKKMQPPAGLQSWLCDLAWVGNTVILLESGKARYHHVNPEMPDSWTCQDVKEVDELVLCCSFDNRPVFLGRSGSEWRVANGPSLQIPKGTSPIGFAQTALGYVVIYESDSAYDQTLTVYTFGNGDVLSTTELN